MRKTIIRLATLAAICQALVVPAMAQETTLKVTATPSIFKEMFEAFVTGFEAENPGIKIDLDASTRDQNDMIQQLLRSAIVNDLPDVSFQGYNYLRLLINQDLPVSLEPFIEADATWSTEVTPSVAESGTMGGKVVGLGVGMSFPIIYYNADLVANAQGGDKSLPDNWDEIITLAEKIEAENPGVVGVGTTGNVFLLQGFLDSYGGALMNADETETGFRTEEFKKTLNLLKQIGESGRTQLTREQMRQSYVSGTVAMTVDSSSSLKSFQSQASFEVATARLPLPAGEAGRVPAAGVASVMLTKDPSRQEAAWKFMRYVASPEAQVVVGEKTGYVPANRIAAERPDLLGNAYASQPEMNALLDSVSVATSWYAFPGSNAAKIDSILTNVMNEVLALRMTPDEAIESLEAEIEPLLP